MYTQNLFINAVILVGGAFISSASAKDCNPVDPTKPFKLTAVSSNGTTYPLAVGGASRGVSVLSTVGQDVSPATFFLNEYVLAGITPLQISHFGKLNSSFTRDKTRVAPTDEPTLLSGEVRNEQPFVFTGTDDFDPLLLYVQTDCVSYLVKGPAEPGAELDVQSWTSSPPSPDGLTVEVYYHGSGGNSAIRLEST